MKQTISIRSRQSLTILALFFFLIPGISPVPAAQSSENPAPARIAPARPFLPGEWLKYDVSWSERLRAGTAYMEVREETLPGGKQVLAFILTGRTRGLMGKLFPVQDRVRSIFDPEEMWSLSFHMSESFGGKKRNRSMVFDREQNAVTGRLNNDPPETMSVPAGAQDGLASLYYLRTKNDFAIGNVFTIDVHSGGKNWSVEVHTLGRERVRTPAGQFDTIKVKTRPLYEGVFRNKGEIFLWLTDDSRKIPVLMKSRIKVGSFVFTLKDMKPGVERPIKISGS